MKQTAVEWLIENCHIVPKNEINKRELIKQAKQMEKEQIIDAVEWNYKSNMGEVYYNATFKL
jgi:hypothetical protein